MFRTCGLLLVLLVGVDPIAISANPIEVRPVSAPGVSTNPWQQSFDAARQLQREQDWYAAGLIFEDTLEIAEQLADGSPRLVWTVGQLAAVRTRLGQPREAIELYERLFDLSDPHRADFVSTRVRALSQLARIHARLGDLELAEQLLRRELALREDRAEVQTVQSAGFDAVLYRLARLVSQLRPEDPEADELIERFVALKPSAARHLEVAKLYVRRGRFDRAIEHYQLGLQLSANRSDAERRVHAGLSFGLARAYWSLGRPDEAEVEYLELLRSQEADLGPQHPSIARTWSRLGAFYVAQERWADAETTLLRALRMTEAAWGTCESCLRGPCTQLARVYDAIDSEPPAACAAEEGRAVDDVDDIDSDVEFPEELRHLEQRITALIRTGEYQAAVELADEALELRRSVYGDLSLELAEGLARLGRLYERQIRLPLAGEVQAERLQLLEQLLPEGDERLPRVLHQLANLAQRRGLDDEAERHLLQEMALRQAGGQRLRVIQILETLGRLNRSAGRFADAATHLSRAAELWAELAGAEAREVAQNLAVADACRVEAAGADAADGQRDESIAQRNPKSPSL